MSKNLLDLLTREMQLVEELENTEAHISSIIDNLDQATRDRDAVKVKLAQIRGFIKDYFKEG